MVYMQDPKIEPKDSRDISDYRIAYRHSIIQPFLGEGRNGVSERREKVYWVRKVCLRVLEMCV